MNFSGKTWLILGAGVRAVTDYLLAKQRNKNIDVVATANSGIIIEPNPSFVWLSDAKAIDIYYQPVADAVDRGSRLLTIADAVLKRPFVEASAYSIFNYPLTEQTEWTPGLMVNGKTSGCALVQFAVNHGAEKVILVGMSGYKSGGGHTHKDYFHGKAGSVNNDKTMRGYGPVLQSVIDQCPDVIFEFYGKPNYDWKGENVAIHDIKSHPVELPDPWLEAYLKAEAEGKTETSKHRQRSVNQKTFARLMFPSRLIR